MITYYKFTSSNCPGCKVLNNHLKDLDTSKYNISEVNLDTDEGMELAMRYNIMSLPVLIKYENNIEIDKMIGFNIQSFKRMFQK